MIELIQKLEDFIEDNRFRDSMSQEVKLAQDLLTILQFKS